MWKKFPPRIAVILYAMISWAGLSPSWAAESVRDCADCPEMVRLPAGLPNMARTEVTQGQWQACVAAGACPDRQTRWRGETMPMTNITAQDAETYLSWLSGMTGHLYRLPTGREWEQAARAGTTTIFPWGDQMAPGRAVCQGCDPRFSHTPAPVGSMAANSFGLYDMNGNVWEWTADCSSRSLPLRTGCSLRVIRGGSWYFFARQSGSSSQSDQDSQVPSYDIGFRPVMDNFTPSR